MKTAVQAGLMPNDFWELTPSELNIIIECYNEKLKQDTKNNITYAYYNAYFQRVKKMPKLDAFLNKIENAGKKKEMTDEQMLEMVKQLHQALRGGK